MARTALATRLVNTALEASGVKISEVTALRVGLREVAVERLVLSSLMGSEKQVLEGLRLGFNLRASSLQGLQIRRANLQIAEPTRQDEPPAPLLLSVLLEQLSAIPLTSLDVEELNVTGATTPLLQQPFKLAAALTGHSLDLEVKDDAASRLTLALKGDPGKPTNASLGVYSAQGKLLQASADISHSPLRHQLQGSAQVDSELLAEFVAPQRPLPPPLAAIAGTLPVNFSVYFDDDLSALENLEAELALAQGSHLRLQLETDSGNPAIELSALEPAAVTVNYTAGELKDISLRAVSLSFSASEVQGEARGHINQLSCRYDKRLECNAGIQLRGEAAELVLAAEPAIELSGLTINAEINLSLDGDNVKAQWPPGPLLQIDRLVQGETTVQGPGLRAVSEGRLDYRLDTGSASLRSQQLDLALPRAAAADLQLATLLHFSKVTVDLGPGTPLTAGAHLSTDGINLKRADTWIPALAVEADIALAGNQLSAAADIASDQNVPLLQFDLLHELDTNRGNGKINSKEIAFSPRKKRLSDYFAHWPFGLDIYEGSLALAGKLNWQQGQEFILAGELDLTASSLAGIYEELGFLGFSGTLPLSLGPANRIATRRDAQLSIRQVDIGFPVNEISARFRLDSAEQSLHLKTFEARVFEGRVWSEDVTYLANRDYNRIDIGVDGVRLDRLLELTGYDAVEGSGVISGLLPLDAGTAGITMHRGMLAAKAPGGVFRYRTEIAPGTNTAMLQVMKALNNYHYSIFQAEADYLESGDLELNMMLRGHNPDMENSRPIQLNLNVTDNIPMLLKSLQSGRVIADKVAKKLGAKP